MGVSGMLAGKYLGNVYDEVTDEMNLKYAGAVPLPVWMQGAMSEEEKGTLRWHSSGGMCSSPHAVSLRHAHRLAHAVRPHRGLHCARGCVLAAAMAKQEVTEDMKKKWLELSRLEEQIYLQQRASRKLA